MRNIAPDYSHFNETSIFKGRRVKISILFDVAVHGVRYVEIVNVRKRYLAWYIRMDHPQVRRLVYIKGR